MSLLADLVSTSRPGNCRRHSSHEKQHQTIGLAINPGGIFFAYISPYRKWVIYSLLAVPFSIAATLLNPWLLVKIVDDYLVIAEVKGADLHGLSSGRGAVVVNYIADAVYTYNLQRAGQMALAT